MGLVLTKDLLIALASGFFGAVLGAYITTAINRSNRRVAAIERMLSLVYSIGRRCWSQPEGERPALVFEEHYSELWAAYSSLKAAMPWYRRKGLDRAWQRYMVMDHYYDHIPNGDFSKYFAKGTHKSRDEAVERSHHFIRYLLALQR
jgi:hypothetical protein